jgi:hypothetical protein
MAAHLGAVVVENDAAGAGGALVDRSDEFGQLLPPAISSIMDYAGGQILHIGWKPSH